jgi:hypothetical protein
VKRAPGDQDMHPSITALLSACHELEARGWVVRPHALAEHALLRVWDRMRWAEPVYDGRLYEEASYRRRLDYARDALRGLACSGLLRPVEEGCLEAPRHWTDCYAVTDAGRALLLERRLAGGE